MERGNLGGVTIGEAIIQTFCHVDVEAGPGDRSHVFLWPWPFYKDLIYLIKLNAEVVATALDWFDSHVLGSLVVVARRLFHIDSVVLCVCDVQELASSQDLVFVFLIVDYADEWFECVFAVLGVCPGIECGKCCIVFAVDANVSIGYEIFRGLGRGAAESGFVGVGSLV